MLSIGKLGVGQERYYLDRVASGIEDYYTGAGETTGRWIGPAAAALGLAGDVTSDQLRAVLAGKHPADGEQLTRARNPRRVPGWDLTFSAPKSVSVLYGLGDPIVVQQVVDAHERAVDQALAYLDRHATVTRRTVEDRELRVHAEGLVVAAFRHRTSRAGDPQLHTHCLAANLTRFDDRWGAVHSPVLYQHARTAGFLYQAVLRCELTDQLGVHWTPVVKGHAEIDGIPTEVLRSFSKRRVEIEEALAAQGEDSARAAQVATLDTRHAKEYGVDPVTLTERWQREAAAIGYQPEDLHLALDRGRVEPTAGQLADIAENLASPVGLTQMDASFRRRDVTRAWCEQLPPGSPASAEAVDALTNAFLTDERVVTLRVDTAADPSAYIEGRWSTTAMIAVERQVLVIGEAYRDSDAGRVAHHVVEQHLAVRSDLTDEQAEMVRTITTSGDGVDVVVGRAGTGKTYALAAAAEIWRTAGYTPIGVGLAARAANELAISAELPATTLAQLLLDCERSPLPLLERRHVVIVDEAAMVDTRRLHQLLIQTQPHGAKVVLVGDHHQLPAVEAGGAFAALTHALGATELSDNRRQIEAWERRTLDRLRVGAGGRAGLEQVIEDYDRHQRIHIAPTAADTKADLVADWHHARHAGVNVAIVALRRRDVTELNNRARALLLEDGTVEPEGVTFAGRTFAVGDEIVCLRNDRDIGVHNALFATVTAVDAKHGLLVERKDTNEAHVLTADYLRDGHVDHAYAMTIHKAQGATVERTLVLADAALHRQSAYTALSRGRISNDIYIPEGSAPPEQLEPHGTHDTDPPSDALLGALGRDAAKGLAIDIIE